MLFNRSRQTSQGSSEGGGGVVNRYWIGMDN